MRLGRGELKFASTQILLAVGIAVGFVREMVLANLFGLGETLDLFRNASLLPVMSSETLNSAFVFALIPALVAAETLPEEKARPRIAACLNVSLLLVLAVFAIGWFGAPTINAALFPGNASPLLSWATRWCWAMFLLSGVTFGLRGLYYQGGKTWPGAATPAVRSIAFIAALFGFHALAVDAPLDLGAAVSALVVSGAAIFLIHLLAIDRATARKIRESLVRPRFDRTVYAPIVAMLMLSLAYYVLNAWPRVIDQGYSSYLPAGSVAAVELSYSITMAFGILFSTAFNMTQAVKISRGFRDRDVGKARASTLAAYRIAILAGGCSILFGFVAEAILSILFGYGRMTTEDVQLVTALFRVQCAGVPFMVLSLIMAQFMIAFGRMRALIGVSLGKCALKYGLVYYAFGAFGIEATVYSFVVVEAVCAFAFVLMVERIIRRNFSTV